jgi:hypothetical protein
LDKRLFNDLPIDLKSFYTFQRAEFVKHRKYGFLKFSLYSYLDFYLEVEHNENGISEIVGLSKVEVKALYK